MSHDNEIHYAGILMADLVGYTSFCETSDLLEIRDIVRTIQATAISIIENWDGAVVNLMGDGVLAAFPEERFDRPVWSAVSAGCIILDEIEKMGKKPKIVPRMHAGVDWGNVWIGSVTNQRLSGSRTILGPPVNRASRYQSIANENEIVIPWNPDVQAMLEEGEAFLPGMRYDKTECDVKGIGKIVLARVKLRETK